MDKQHYHSLPVEEYQRLATARDRYEVEMTRLQAIKEPQATITIELRSSDYYLGHSFGERNHNYCFRVRFNSSSSPFSADASTSLNEFHKVLTKITEVYNEAENRNIKQEEKLKLLYKEVESKYKAWQEERIKVDEARMKLAEKLAKVTWFERLFKL